jgi:hypothetical protein
MPLPRTRLSRNPAFVVRGDPHRPVHARQWFEFPGRGDGRPETWLYADRLVCAPGEWVTLCAISTGARLDIELWSETLEPRRMLALSDVAAGWADTPEDASVAGCGWPAVAEIEIGADWPSGVTRIAGNKGAASAAVASHAVGLGLDFRLGEGERIDFPVDRPPNRRVGDAQRRVILAQAAQERMVGARHVGCMADQVVGDLARRGGV